MSEGQHLVVCGACRTAIPETASVCPECGAPQPPEGLADAGAQTTGSGAGAPGGGAPPSGGVPPGFEDLFAAMGQAFGTPPPEARRAMTGLALRAMLQRYGGCLVTALALLFGTVLLFGALTGDTLGVLGVMLLVVGLVGLVLTGWIVALLRASRPRR